MKKKRLEEEIKFGTRNLKSVSLGVRVITLQHLSHFVSELQELNKIIYDSDDGI
jgi:hypothetical protein